MHAVLTDPIVSYRETIKGQASVQGKHKKQSGGAGQYGDVFIKFEHSEKEFEFIDDIHGGVVPKSFIPAVEKGLLEAKEKGTLAGYPVIILKLHFMMVLTTQLTLMRFHLTSSNTSF